jgi:hypothetical protein
MIDWQNVFFAGERGRYNYAVYKRFTLDVRRNVK